MVRQADHNPAGKGTWRIFISAAEPSADLHAAAMIRAFRSRWPETEFVGIAGPEMQRAGCRCLFDFTGRSAMLAKVAGLAGEAARVLLQVDRLFASAPLDAVVLVDSPTLHLPMARRAHARRLSVFYYIAPQVWAWGAFRIGKIRRRVDRLAVILPFEEDYFRRRGVSARFVGHPLIERLRQRSVDGRMVERLRGAGRPVLTLLPGSRLHVIREVLPGQLDVARQVRQHHRRTRVLISAASERAAGLIRQLMAETDVPAELHLGRNPEIITAADIVLVASGTATLEVAYYRRPMVVMYNASRLGYHLLGRWLMRPGPLSLVNILAGEHLVPEYMPYYRSTRTIAQRVIELLATPPQQERIVRGLDRIIRSVSMPGVSQRVAEELETLLRERPRRPLPPGSRHAVW